MTENYEKDFVPYEPSLDLKELGFDEPCFSIYYSKDKSFSWHHHKDHTNDEPMLDNEEFNISAPTFSQAFRWFREKHGLSGNIDCCDKLCEWNIKSSKLDKSIFSNNIQSYEEAELECLKKLIEIVKQQL
jgi:hypothetical protein